LRPRVPKTHFRNQSPIKRAKTPVYETGLFANEPLSVVGSAVPVWRLVGADPACSHAGSDSACADLPLLFCHYLPAQGSFLTVDPKNFLKFAKIGPEGGHLRVSRPCGPVDIIPESGGTGRTPPRQWVGGGFRTSDVLGATTQVGSSRLPAEVRHDATCLPSPKRRGAAHLRAINTIHPGATTSITPQMGVLAKTAAAGATAVS